MAKIFHDHITKWVTLILTILIIMVGWLLTNASGKAKMEQEILTIQTEQVTDDTEDKAQEVLVTAIDKRQALMQRDVGEIKEDMKDMRKEQKESDKKILRAIEATQDKKGKKIFNLF